MKTLHANGYDKSREWARWYQQQLLPPSATGAAFRKGRELAAWLGFVPKQHSTGGKAKLYGITKSTSPKAARLHPVITL